MGTCCIIDTFSFILSAEDIIYKGCWLICFIVYECECVYKCMYSRSYIINVYCDYGGQAAVNRENDREDTNRR